MASINAQTTDQRALVASAQAGDERAFRALVEPYRRALEIHCYRMLGTPHDAEEVTQETLLRAWRSLERFHGRSSIHTWLYRIATNACLDELERRPRRAQPVVEPYPDDRLLRVEDPVVDPAARYAQREGIELAFLIAIQQLPGRQRAVLILRDVLGWTGIEVAELLESTVAAVNSALQRARATIEHELPTRSVSPGRATERDLLRRYIEAWESDDIDGLVALLREDAVLSMPPQPSVLGAAAIGAFFTRVRSAHARLSATATSANGRPAVALRERAPDGSSNPHRLLVLEIDSDRITEIHAYGEQRLLRMFGV
jgi:RNA polymerase sigma-70 factor, ECF subfamily